MTVTWNPSDCSTNIALSGSNLTATNTSAGGNGGVRANVSLTTGKLYWETLIVANNYTNYNTVGATLLSTALSGVYEANGGVGVAAGGEIYLNGSDYSVTIGDTVGQVVCHALDLGAMLYWVRRGDGPWNASGSADPAAGTGGIDVSAVFTGAVAPCMASSSSTAGQMEVTADFGASTYVCIVPSGFLNVDGSTPTGPTNTAVTWDPNDAAVGITLSGGNLTAANVASAGNVGVYALTSQTAGKFYFESYCNANDTSVYSVAGVAPRSLSLNNLYSATGGVGVGQSSGVGEIILNATQNTALATTSVLHTICHAIDLTAKLYWAKIDGGLWNNSGTADPATGVGGIDISSVFSGQAAAPFMSSSSAGTAGTSFTANFGGTSYAYTAPSGFGNWPVLSSPASNVWASTETPDSMVFLVRNGYPGVVADLAVTEILDVLAAVGYPASVGTWIVQETPDSMSARVIQPLTGTLATTETLDTFLAHGVGFGVNIDFNLTELLDIAHFLVDAVQPTNGVLAATETPDRFQALGAGAVRPSTSQTVIFFVA
jgi:hypothetical protein